MIFLRYSMGKKSELSTSALHHLIDVCLSSDVAIAIDLLLADTSLFETSGLMSWVLKHLINLEREAERLVTLISKIPINSLSRRIV